jgi:hypothetical protein
MTLSLWKHAFKYASMYRHTRGAVCGAAAPASPCHRTADCEAPPPVAVIPPSARVRVCVAAGRAVTGFPRGVSTLLAALLVPTSRLSHAAPRGTRPRADPRQVEGGRGASRLQGVRARACVQDEGCLSGACWLPLVQQNSLLRAGGRTENVQRAAPTCLARC